MTLTEAKEILEEIEPLLAGEVFVVAHAFVRDGRELRVAVTERLRHRAKTGRVWKSVPFLTAFKNAEYGFDESRARSTGGMDGLFLFDRTYSPPNEMMRKIFDCYLDKPESGCEDVAEKLGIPVENLLAVRLVSHHLRLLGVFHRAETEDWLVLVDYDDTK